MAPLILPLVLLTFFNTSSVVAETRAEAQSTFEKANEMYEKARIDDALSGYASLAGQGFGGAALFYNLGNVHYRRGERGRAVLWYERAMRIDPRDSDVRFNLSLARSHIKSDGDNILRRAATYFTLNELCTATAVFSFMFFSIIGLWTLGKLRGDIWPAMSLIVTGVLFAGAGTWLGARAYVDRQPQAIVISPPGEVRNGPGNDYAVGFTVPEGTRVVILNTRPEWTQVGVPEQGLKGWMPTREIEEISSPGLS